MEARPRTLKSVFHPNVRLEVPLFQRRYVWTAEQQWEPLWEDVLATLERMRGDDSLPHFMGAIVLEHVRRPHGSIEVRQVIDGQQRLTTLQLMTAAVRDVAVELGASTRTVKRLGVLLENDPEIIDSADDVFRLWPTNADRADFRAVLTGAHRRSCAADAGSSRIVGAYLWFMREVERWLEPVAPDERADRIDELTTVIADGLETVVIDLGPEDNAQVIFETLNARGTALLASDLIKNLIFRTLQGASRPSDHLYEKHWRPLEEDHWRTEVRQGRLMRPRLDAFVGHFLVVHLQREVQAHQLFSSLRDHVGRSADRAEEVLVELSRYAQVYDRIERREDLTEREVASLERLAIADTQTVQPLLLWLFANHAGPERARALAALESYLVRRAICRLSGKNYNRIFLDLLRRLTNGEGAPGEFVTSYLARQGSDSGVWPSDEELERSILILPAYKLLKRAKLNQVLVALEEQSRGPRTESVRLTGKLSVEHLVPQQWQDNWPLAVPGGPSDDAAERDALLHTLGNLTLLTQPLNSAISNGSWDRKRAEITQLSSLRLNSGLPVVFGNESVRARGRYLASLAAAVWRRPPLALGQTTYVDEAERDLRPDREGARPRPSRAPQSTPSASGRRRDIAAHIAHAFADLPVGSFLTVSQIRNTPSPEYEGTAPSAGAISARLFPASGPMTLVGVVPDQRNGVRGARKTAA
ncbi:uncharacterized protein DUF1524 [Geodermatophilus tzadiensis]|uniref:Uncharacterized protein DUF1524 n=1 Tax=Geodermatophilus tzadiensis TaxID=1137988 RepID=A0A2T0T0Y8_9ACTN|nr:DUF262 domain-containing protein [Geodermatophilus tzadiensis]PRY39335.1 uncharacterized protein DUF1524 [Geodermatophilus tzadiensis]